MATPAQIRANQQNAKKSTGPKTKEGMAKSSKNSIKHGIFSSSMSLSCEDPGEYQEILNSLISELEPRTNLEMFCISTIARCIIKQNRLSRAEIARYKLRTLDASVLSEVNKICYPSTYTSLGVQDLSDPKAEQNARFYKQLHAELAQIGSDLSSHDEKSFMKAYPYLYYFLLHVDADKDNFNKELFNSQKELLELIQSKKEIINKYVTHYHNRVSGQEIAKLVKESHIIPDEEIMDRFQRYQTDIQREFKQAMDGLMRARKIAEKSIDGIAIEVLD